jgi:hypothetical protein
MKEIIDEYEYSGIFPDAKIKTSLSGNFLEKRKTIQDLKLFIHKIIKKYL